MFLQLHAHTSTTKTKKEKTQSSCHEAYIASFPGSHAPECEIEVVHAWRAWYFLSREKRKR